MGRTLPMRVPDLSAISTSGSSAVPKPPAVERTPQAPTHEPPTVPPPPPAPPQKFAPPVSVPDFSAPVKPAQPIAPVVTAPSPVARPTVAAPAPMPQPDASTETIHFDDAPTDVSHAPKSKLLPILVGVAALLFLAVAGMGFWIFHHSRTTSPGHEVVQTQPVIPPPVQTPVIVPPPTLAPPVEQPALPGAPPSQVAKKPLPKKVKPTAAPRQEPAPAPAPVVVTPPSAPEPSGPSPAEIARAEAARLAATAPRIINVTCTFTLKEATFIFSGGGKPLHQETEKGKKKKGSGFLGIKGSYEGSFSHTLTVPAGVTQLSVRVESKDGSMDVSNAIKMPAPGGFVPTLAMQVDNEHLTLVWKGPPGT